MYDYIIIGGGASGVSAAIKLGREKKQVLVLEKNNTILKKILVTGNGKCNFFNDDQSITHYHSHDKNLIPLLINKENIEKVKAFLSSLNFKYKNINGLYYPTSNQAQTVANRLEQIAKLNNVKIKNNFEVTKIEKEKDHFIIYSDNEKLLCKKLIISSGSSAYQKTNTIDLLNSIGLKTTDINPALVQLESDAYFVKNWGGVRQDAEVSLYEDNNLISKEKGEIQLTNYGISGICVMQQSYIVDELIKDNKHITAHINFLKEESINSLKEYFNKISNYNILDAMIGLLNKKLANVILEICKINNTSTWNNLDSETKSLLINNILDFKLNITKTNGFSSAQTVYGGISLKDINLNNMESKIIDNLFLTGEVIDLTGECGGYNLTIAWLTGVLVDD